MAWVRRSRKLGAMEGKTVSIQLEVEGSLARRSEGHGATASSRPTTRSTRSGRRPSTVPPAHDPPRGPPTARGSPAWSAGDPSSSQWTRTQRIRTAAQIRVEAALVDAAPPPVYQQIVGKVEHLHELGMSNRAIARAIGVDDKTVAKALKERQDLSLPRGGE